MLTQPAALSPDRSSSNQSDVENDGTDHLACGALCRVKEKGPRLNQSTVDQVIETHDRGEPAILGMDGAFGISQSNQDTNRDPDRLGALAG